MRQSTLLLVNSVATYARMALTVGMGLLISRLLVRLLGYSDFGLLAAVGAAGAVLPMLINALTASSQRHMAFEIGRGDDDRLRSVLATAVAIYGAAGVALALVGWALAGPVLAALTVPAGRESAAAWVFHLSLLALVLNVLVVPYRAFLTARQSIVALSVLDLLGRGGSLAAVLLLTVLPTDRLATYAALNVGLMATVGAVTVATCWARFPVSRPAPRSFRRADLAALGGFAGWTLLGQFEYFAATQGGVLLINHAFGPAANAGYSLALQAAAYQTQLGGALFLAIQPAMTGLHARGEHAAVRSLAVTASKLSFLAVLLLLVPLCLEAETVLRLWLVEYPPDTPAFVRLLTVNAALGMLLSGHVLALNARGQIGRLTLVSMPLQLVPLSVAAALFTWGRGPVWLPLAVVATSVVGGLCFMPWYLGRMIGLPGGEWARRVTLPCGAVAALGLLVGTVLRLGLDPGVLRVLAVGLASAATVCTAAWSIGLGPAERDHLRRIAGVARARSSGRGAVVVEAIPADPSCVGPVASEVPPTIH